MRTLGALPARCRSSPSAAWPRSTSPRPHGVGGFEKLVALKVIHPNYSRRSRVRADARRRGQAVGAAAARQHRPDLRPRPRRRAVLHRDGADRRRRSLQAPAHAPPSRSIDFPFEVAAFIAAEICAAASTTRTASATPTGRPLQIVHRDISPQNMLCQLRRRGEDRRLRHRQGGAARPSRPPPASSRASTTTCRPEQAWGDPIDARTDIFSTGILLYEMLVGQMLYLEEDLETLLDIGAQGATSRRRRRSARACRASSRAIVMRRSKKRADDRYPDGAASWRRRSQQFLHGFAPDFSRARLATFVREVMGDDPTAAQPRSARRRRRTRPTPPAWSRPSRCATRTRSSSRCSDLQARAGASRRRRSPRHRAPPPVPRRAPTWRPTSRAGRRLRGERSDHRRHRRHAAGAHGSRRHVGDDDRTRPAGPAVRRGRPRCRRASSISAKTIRRRDDDLDAADACPTTRTTQPTGAREMPPPRTHETRRVESPPLDERRRSADARWRSSRRRPRSSRRASGAPDAARGAAAIRTRREPVDTKSVDDADAAGARSRMRPTRVARRSRHQAAHAQAAAQGSRRRPDASATTSREMTVNARRADNRCPRNRRARRRRRCSTIPAAVPQVSSAAGDPGHAAVAQSDGRVAQAVGAHVVRRADAHPAGAAAAARLGPLHARAWNRVTTATPARALQPAARRARRHACARRVATASTVRRRHAQRRRARRRRRRHARRRPATAAARSSRWCRCRPAPRCASTAPRGRS